jgi:single-strand DNA-binding protein
MVMKRNSTSSHCRINQKKNQTKSITKKSKYEHHRKTDKRCGSTHNVNDKQVVNFSVAVNDSYKNKQGERIEQTTYFDCAYWITANVARLLTKGTLVELTGSKHKSVDRQRRRSKSRFEFPYLKIKLHGGSRRTETVQATAQSETTDLQHREEDDLPF